MSRAPPSRRGASPLPPGGGPPRSFAGSYNGGGGGFPGGGPPPPPFSQGPPGPPPAHSGFLEAPPRPRPGKRLILCEDGTWQTSDGNIAQKRRTSKVVGGITAAAASPSNVVRLARAIRPVSRDGIPQVVNYHVGVGVGGGVVDKVYGGVSGEGECSSLIRFVRCLIFDSMRLERRAFCSMWNLSCSFSSSMLSY